MSRLPVDVVVPTIGRASARRVFAALAAGDGPALRDVIVVVDRGGRAPEGLDGLAAVARDVRVVGGRGAGPAAARNIGWRLAGAPWVAFLDDDVVPEPAWRARLAEDLAGLPDDVAGSQGVIRVPRPEGRRPTDWERNVAGLEDARWATADMAYRRAALSALGGFDERFPRAYREDADLALRAMDRGLRLVRGRRRVDHPVGPAGPWISLRAQAGNADDVLMDALHGPGWRDRAGAPPGRRDRHLLTAAAGAAAAASVAAGRPRLAALAATAWLAATAELAWARIAPGPRTPREVALMAATSAAMPVAAAHTARGLARRRRLLADRARAPSPAPLGARPEAVLLDRDGTLIVDVPYNGDPERVAPMPGAREAIDRLRRAGVRTGVVSNQSGIGRGLLDERQVAAVNRRVEGLLGDLGPWMVCPHAPGDACGCRKPEPGLVIGAARELGVDPADCVVVGDIGADVEAARRAGARAVLVPTPRTLPEEIAAAPAVAPDLVAAVEMILGSPA
ncbi:HAD-IIIA family hydrolase [Miltoncostaea marina]|uniref:HAD-IIIA family hydrolase n=1 Tax=Miltoncostaea marina TaxID=2843215 RepID=UPI001C3E3267|nr:HAD-IIIA family hydrolase [Miltoncostaea marina]